MGFDRRNGPQAGRRWPIETEEYVDPETGANVRKLTDHRAHGHQLYYTNTSWYDQQRRVLFGSERGGTPNLFSLEVGTGRITQLTDLPEGTFEHQLSPPVSRTFAGGASIHPTRSEAYFWYDGTLLTLNLEDLSLQPLYDVPDGFRPLRTSVTADGKFVCTGITEQIGDLSSAERQQARPSSKLLRIPIDGGDTEILHEEEYWLGHPNASPADANVMTFAHEGPWETLDNRIWAIDMETGEVRKLRPKGGDVAYEGIGHEHWHADGRLGYHGYYESGEPFYGITTVVDTDPKEAVIQKAELLQLDVHGQLSHFHHTDGMIVSDCNVNFPHLVLWPIDEESGELGEPRKLMYHGGAFQHPRLHVHPRFSPDGEQVLFSSNRSEYQNLYIVEIPQLEELPVAEL